ncbi:Metal-sensitive transcriptional repressor [Thermoflexibacter ruber]|uniref:Metal-sensitive transcriptional repressor n=2 Tax=Thermoflexibacter ruber TaxID=1003 RepID=A0A1I2K9D6_9BACT|nr:Metal-sensitive transcriptional repressor [Thermoflexibacter ruber]
MTVLPLTKILIMIPRDLTQDIKTRLATIGGQVNGLIKMLDKEEDPEKIITQFKAVDNGLDTAYNLLLDEVYRKALAIKIVEVADACPGNCGNEEKIDFIRTQFPKFKMDEILKKFKEITKIGERVKEHQKKNL